MRDLVNVNEAYVALAPLYSAYVTSVELREQRQFLLGKTSFPANLSDTITKRLSGSFPKFLNHS